MFAKSDHLLTAEVCDTFIVNIYLPTEYRHESSKSACLLPKLEPRISNGYCREGFNCNLIKKCIVHLWLDILARYQMETFFYLSLLTLRIYTTGSTNHRWHSPFREFSMWLTALLLSVALITIIVWLCDIILSLLISLPTQK